MKNQKIIILAEISVIPQYLEEIKALSAATVAPTLLEPGCECFYETSRDGDPNSIVLFEVFSDQAAHDAHLETDYTKNFIAGIQGKLTAAPLISFLNTLAEV